MENVETGVNTMTVQVFSSGIGSQKPVSEIKKVKNPLDLKRLELQELNSKMRFRIVEKNVLNGYQQFTSKLGGQFNFSIDFFELVQWNISSKSSLKELLEMKKLLTLFKYDEFDSRKKFAVHGFCSHQSYDRMVKTVQILIGQILRARIAVLNATSR